MFLTSNQTSVIYPLPDTSWYTLECDHSYVIMYYFMGIEFNVNQMLPSLFFNYLTLGYLNSLMPDDSVKLKLN